MNPIYGWSNEEILEYFLFTVSHLGIDSKSSDDVKATIIEILRRMNETK